MNQSYIELALQIEEKGYKYYKHHAESAKNPLSRKVLESLAKQELEHQEWIRVLTTGSKLPADLQGESIEMAVKAVFDSFSAKERQGWKSDSADVYKHAMELEEDAYELYKKMEADADDQELKKFFQMMMKAEREHYTSLENVYRFFAEPGDWLQQDESASGWNWITT